MALSQRDGDGEVRLPLWRVFLSCMFFSYKYLEYLGLTLSRGVTLQTSATTAAQFTLGRIINFGMTGFCIVVTPIYQAECSPPALRGLISSTVQFQITLGQLIASLVNLGTENITSNSSWQIPIGTRLEAYGDW